MTDYSLRIAVRRLLSAPAFTIFSIITLSLGIGATSAIYSVIYAVALRPPDFADGGRVVNLSHANALALGGLSAKMSAFSSPDFEDLTRTATSFSGIAPWSMFRGTVVANGAEGVFGELVGGDYFNVLGVRAALGRTIQPQDDRPGAPPVVVLSDAIRMWRYGIYKSLRRTAAVTLHS